MYNTNLNVETVRKIDSIVQTPKVNKEEIKVSKDFSFTPEYVFEGNMEEIVARATEALEVVNTELSFRVHEGTGRPVIQLINNETREVVREIPPEKMLDIVAGIWEWAGLIIDRKE